MSMCRVFSCVVGRGCLLWPLLTYNFLFCGILVWFWLQVMLASMIMFRSISPLLLFFPISLLCSFKNAFLPLLAVVWNSVFSWVYISLSPLFFASLLFSGICKISSDNQFAFLHFFFFGMILVTVSYTMLQISIRSSFGNLSTRSNLLNLFVTSTI